MATVGRRALLALFAMVLATAVGVTFLGPRHGPSGEDRDSSGPPDSLSSSLQDSGPKNSSAPARMPYVPYTPIMGESITKDEAIEVSPFAIIFPENIPGDLRLVDIRHYTVGDSRHYFILIYATSKLPKNTNLWGLLYSGGMMLIEGQHGFSEDYIRSLIEETEQGKVANNVNNVVETVNNNKVILIDTTLKHEAKSFVGELSYDVVAGPNIDMDEVRAVVDSITTTLGTLGHKGP